MRGRGDDETDRIYKAIFSLVIKNKKVLRALLCVTDEKTYK